MIAGMLGPFYLLCNSTKVAVRGGILVAFDLQYSEPHVLAERVAGPPLLCRQEFPTKESRRIFMAGPST
jgi:hypothetical protein